MEIVKNELRIGACKMNCQNKTCPNRSYGMSRELKLRHCNGKHKLFVRHARYNKNGQKYSYGDWHCALKIIEDRSDFFSSSERFWIKSIIGE